jgi:hypothetical protein
MAVDAEEVQELGRDGVASVKRWLEATTFIELNWNVYEDAPMCVMTCLGGIRKKFDLAGSFIGQRRNPVVVESKWYRTAGAQHKYYKEFLATAYSSTVKEMEERGDTGREYLWVTKHPFQIGEWTTLTTEEKIKASLVEYPTLLDNREIDAGVLRKVSERIWVLVMHQKQEDISLTNEELMIVLAKLARKAPTL